MAAFLNNLTSALTEAYTVSLAWQTRFFLQKLCSLKPLG